MSKLAGKRILVTGAAGGVGRALATRMVGEGARLLLTDRSADAVQGLVGELRGLGREVHGTAAELTRPEDVARLFQDVDACLGGLDMLIACAAVGSGPLLEMDDDAWREVIDINLVSYLACTRAALERLKANADKEGMVILVGSISVHIKAVGESVYNAAKGGVASFAETLRKELIPHEVRLTLIEPGAIASAMQPFSAEERAALVADYQLLPPAEVAEAILFAATRPRGVDVVTLRIEPLRQKIY